jgi:hypothetical protein
MSRFAKKARSHPVALQSHIQSVEFAFVSLQRTGRGLAGMLIACAILGMTVFQMPPGTLGRRSYMPVILSTVLLTFAYSTRNAMVLPALAELRRNPRNEQVLRRWHRYSLIVQSLCAGVGLVGFAMQLMGAATPIALTLYAIALGYLWLLRPVRP